MGEFDQMDGRLHKEFFTLIYMIKKHSQHVLDTPISQSAPVSTSTTTTSSSSQNRNSFFQPAPTPAPAPRHQPQPQQNLQNMTNFMNAVARVETGFAADMNALNNFNNSFNF